MKFQNASGMKITSFYKYCSTQSWLWENSEVVCCLVCSGTRLYLENVRNKVYNFIVPSRDDTFSLLFSMMYKKIGQRNRHFRSAIEVHIRLPYSCKKVYLFIFRSRQSKNIKKLTHMIDFG